MTGLGIEADCRAKEIKIPTLSQKAREGWGIRMSGVRLAVAGHGTQLPGQEVVRRPGSADGDFAVLQLLGGAAIAVLIFLYRLGVDEMGDVDEHALRSDLLAAHFLFQRVKQLMDLYREGAGFGLAFAIAGYLDLQLRKIVAPAGVGQDDIDHSLAERAISDRELDVHLGLAAEPDDAQTESAPVDPDRLAEGVVAFE